MWKVALVGHSQIPPVFDFPNVEVKIFRAPGGRACNFPEDARMNKVLEWEHDLTILWIGSNDVNVNTTPEIIFNDIKSICFEIQVSCQSVVYICQVEPRVRTRNISADQYKKYQTGINNRIKRSKIPNIHFNNLRFVEELSGDGVHWGEAGRVRVEAKFRKVVKLFIGEDDVEADV